MDRLARFDATRGFQRPQSRVAVQMLFGVGCAAAMMAVRGLVDIWAPTAGPFALVYPTVLLATLYGHWQAGAVAYMLSFLWAWWYVLPARMDFHFEVATDPSRVALNALSALVVLVFAETFRRAVARAAAERDREIERRATLHAELEHRTKNNFALVASLLEIQRKREPAPGVAHALDDAIGRVRTFADAYSTLPQDGADGIRIDMRPYLQQLLERLGKAAFDGRVALSSAIDPIELPRETAVAVGLYVNEAVTNCAKYAFPDGRAGRVTVSLEGGEGWRLRVEDDGVGAAAAPRIAGGGLGGSLMEAFARQAGAEHRIERDAAGYRLELAARRRPFEAAA